MVPNPELGLKQRAAVACHLEPLAAREQSVRALEQRAELRDSSAPREEQQWARRTLPLLVVVEQRLEQPLAELLPLSESGDEVFAVQQMEERGGPEELPKWFLAGPVCAGSQWLILTPPSSLRRWTRLRARLLQQSSLHH